MNTPANTAPAAKPHAAAHTPAPRRTQAGSATPHRLEGGPAATGRPLRLCFVGLGNLPVVSPEHKRHGVGGEEVQHTLLARALVRRGFEVSMVVGDLGQPDGLVVDGITLHKAYGPHDGIPVLRFLHPRLTRLRAALQRADADVYYVSCAGMTLGVTVQHAARHGKRVVFRIAHDRDCEPDNLLVKYWRDRKIYEWGLRRTDVILAQSVQQQRALRQNYGLTSALAAMLVEPRQKPIAFAERDIDVLWVNNIRNFKRPDLLLALAARLPQLSFHMIGGTQPGHEAQFHEIKARAAALPNLHFHGLVPYHDVNGFYERACVFVNTSDSEGFPNSYLQAWRRGTPTVAFFDPDAVVARRGLGKTVSSMDDMAAEVERYARTEAPWQTTSDACLCFMDMHYGDDKVLAPYIEAFAPALAHALAPATASASADPRPVPARPAGQASR